jgi:hypothetical protein
MYTAPARSTLAARLVTAQLADTAPRASSPLPVAVALTLDLRARPGLQLCGGCEWCCLVPVRNRVGEYLANLERDEEPGADAAAAWAVDAYPACTTH